MLQFINFEPSVYVINSDQLKKTNVCSDSHDSSTYGSDWLPLSTDGFVVTITAADGAWPLCDDPAIVPDVSK